MAQVANPTLISPFGPGQYIFSEDGVVRETTEKYSQKIGNVRQEQLVEIKDLYKTEDRRLIGELSSGGWVTIVDIAKPNIYAHMVVFSGFLEEESSRLSRSFQRRFFCLKNNCEIDYFIMEFKYKQGSIPLYGLNEIVDSQHVNKDFEVQTAMKTWFFRAKTEAEKEKWKAAIQEVRDQATEGITDDIWQNPEPEPEPAQEPVVNQQSMYGFAPVFGQNQNSVQLNNSMNSIDLNNHGMKRGPSVPQPASVNQAYVPQAPPAPLYAPVQQLPPLANGWEEAYDPSSGKTFYVNHMTQVTQWDRPVDEQAVPGQSI